MSSHPHAKHSYRKLKSLRWNAELLPRLAKKKEFIPVVSQGGRKVVVKECDNINPSTDTLVRTCESITEASGPMQWRLKLGGPTHVRYYVGVVCADDRSKLWMSDGTFDGLECQENCMLLSQPNYEGQYDFTAGNTIELSYDPRTQHLNFKVEGNQPGLINHTIRLVGARGKEIVPCCNPWADGQSYTILSRSGVTKQEYEKEQHKLLIEKVDRMAALIEVMAASMGLNEGQPSKQRRYRGNQARRPSSGTPHCGRIVMSSATPQHPPQQGQSSPQQSQNRGQFGAHNRPAQALH